MWVHFCVCEPCGQFLYQTNKTVKTHVYHIAIHVGSWEAFFFILLSLTYQILNKLSVFTSKHKLCELNDLHHTYRPLFSSSLLICMTIVISLISENISNSPFNIIQRPRTTKIYNYILIFIDNEKNTGDNLS